MIEGVRLAINDHNVKEKYTSGLRGEPKAHVCESKLNTESELVEGIIYSDKLMNNDAN